MTKQIIYDKLVRNGYKVTNCNGNYFVTDKHGRVQKFNTLNEAHKYYYGYK